ncbi:MAG: hypothetical protein MK226_16840 [Saprospiraceae bacterium]|nr:hypothetical protein [Saprospiraceae bacterium]
MLASFVQSSAGNTGDKIAQASKTERYAAQQIAISSQSNLPVTLNRFQASSCNFSSVCIFWETKVEIENDYFTIERSQDGISWEQIEIINGAGNYSELLSYETTDFFLLRTFLIIV